MEETKELTYSVCPSVNSRFFLSDNENSDDKNITF